MNLKRKGKKRNNHTLITNTINPHQPQTLPSINLLARGNYAVFKGLVLCQHLSVGSVGCHYNEPSECATARQHKSG